MLRRDQFGSGFPRSDRALCWDGHGERVSRTLEKLSRILQGKGVAVPVTVIGGVMTAQLGKASAGGITASLAHITLANLTTISTSLGFLRRTNNGFPGSATLTRQFVSQ